MDKEMFHKKMSMIWVQYGLDGKKGVWMTFSLCANIEKTCDHVKKSTIEAKHLKNLTG
jgi:hypothetical protein